MGICDRITRISGTKVNKRLNMHGINWLYIVRFDLLLTIFCLSNKF